MRWGPSLGAALLVTHVWAGASTGITPLDELGSGLYRSEQGGLYPGGANVPPPSHLAAALEAAGTVVPRDPAGIPSADGLIGFVAVGMSNTTQEFKLFERDQDLNPLRNGRVVIVNGALGGVTSLEWTDPNHPVWQTLEERVRATGLTREQVQVIWLKHGDGSPETLAFPDHALALESDLAAIVRNVKSKYPNVVLAYLASRTYGGWSDRPEHGEPLCFETGFSVKWLIEDQIEGDPALNFDPSRGPVTAPLLLWGPYLWTDGELARSDGLTWLREDLELDAIHLRMSGERKVADLMDRFFRVEATARPWWGQDALTDLVAIDATADASVEQGSPDLNTGPSTFLRTSGSTNVGRAYMKFDLSALGGAEIHNAKLSLRTLTECRGVMRSSGSTSWVENAITWNNAPPVDTALLGSIPSWSADSSMSHDVTDYVGADADGIVTLVIEGLESTARKWESRESGEPPRLILSVATSRITVRLDKDPESGGVLLRWNDNGAAPFLVRRALGPSPADFASSVDTSAGGVDFVDPGVLSAPESYWYLVE